MTTNENAQAVVRCIGKPNEDVKVYLEERSDLFLKENITNRVGHFQLYYVLGREYRLGKQTIYLIRGILEGESGGSRPVNFSAGQLRLVKRRQERQYPKFKVLGWALNQPGYGSDGAWRFARDNDSFYQEAPILLLSDGMDGSFTFYHWQDGDYKELGGYYVYTDQDPADFRSEQPIAVWKTEETEVEEDKGETRPWELPVMEEQHRSLLERLTLREKRDTVRNEIPAQVATGASPLRVLTSLSAILLMVTLVMGMLLFNSVSALDGIQSRLETMDLQIEEIHQTMTTSGTVAVDAPIGEENE